MRHSLANRWSAYYLAMGVILVALINLAPAIYEGVQAYGHQPPRPVGGWAYGALLLGLIHLAYAVYLIQLPDWSSVWVVAVLSLATTTLYAALVSVFILGSSDSAVLSSIHLNHVSRRVPLAWSTIMLIVSASLTYVAGRVGFRFHKSFVVAFPQGVKS